MSLMGMNRAFKKHGAIFGGVLAFFVVGGIAFTSFGTNNFGGGRAAGPDTSGNGGPGAAGAKPIATVDGRAITKAELDQRLDAVIRQQAMMSGQPAQTPPPEQMNSLRALVLDKYYKQQAALILVAKQNNITVSDADLARERDKAWESGRKQVAQTLGLKDTATDADIDRTLATQSPGLTVARIKSEQIPDEGLRLQLLQKGLQDLFKKQAATAPGAGKPSPDDQIQVRHILIKSGKGSLTDAQAKAKADGLLVQIKADPAKMEALAKANSDDPGSKDKGGFYDWAPAKQYVPEFSKAALAAGVGKVYGQPVKTQFGYHIIKLEGERPDVDGAAQKKLGDAITAALPQVKMEIADSGVRAAQLQNEAQTIKDAKARDAKLSEALAELNKVSKTDDPLGATVLQKATLLQEMKRPKEAIPAYEEALTLRNTVETRLALADLYVGEKDITNAKKQLTEAEKLAIPDVQTQFRYAALLDKVGDKEKSKAAMNKASEMGRQQMAQMMQQQAPPPAPKPVASPVATTSPAPVASAGTAASPAPAPAAASPAASASPATSPSAASAPPASK